MGNIILILSGKRTDSNKQVDPMDNALRYHKSQEVDNLWIMKAI